MNFATPTGPLSFRGAASAHAIREVVSQGNNILCCLWGVRALGQSDPSQPGTKSWTGSEWDGDDQQTFEVSCHSSDTSHRFLPTFIQY